MKQLLLPAALLSAAALSAGLAGCGPQDSQPKKGTVTPMPTKSAAKIETRDFGTVDGKTAHLYTLTNANGMVAKITDYGTILTELWVPDKSGKTTDVVLGFDNLEAYLKGHPFFGAIAGRCANRIAKGKFTLDGKAYQLATNNGVNALHGGVKGFDKHLWTAEPPKETPEGIVLTLSRTSPDGEEGYPGTLQVSCTYTLTNRNELKVEFAATTDKATPVNLAHHSYWNLGGAAAGDILGHELQINADAYTPVDDTLIPTGQTPPVEGTPFDFRAPKAIGKDVARAGGDPVGFDHNFVLNGKMGDLRWAARLTDPKSGRQLEILTTEPGVQFYTGNFLDGSLTGKGSVVYKKHQGLCLETQHFPDSINKPQWPTVVLKPGETYRHVMVHAFTAK
jgi:aldose 1-epimerase